MDTDNSNPTRGEVEITSATTTATFHRSNSAHDSVVASVDHEDHDDEHDLDVSQSSSLLDHDHHDGTTVDDAPSTNTSMEDSTPQQNCASADPHTPLTMAAFSKLNVKATQWARPPVDHFEDMNLRQFHRYSRRQPDVLHESALGPTSMKHPTWDGSDAPPGPLAPLLVLTGLSVGLAVAVGLVVGLTKEDAAWGVAAAVCVAGAAFLVFFVSLVTYMLCYSNGLHDPPMATCVERGGFVRNMRANIVCRNFMTCCHNGHCDMVFCIMNGEAGNTYKKIQGMNHGHGPPPGGICWLGDSEFTFWHNLEQDMEAFHSNHINAGFGGSRIIDIQANVHRLCLDWDPSTVIVHASGNDYDFDTDITAKEIPAKLMKLFETIAAHPSVERIGYMLSSRRPVYDDAKWDFMVRVHSLTMYAIAHSTLHDIVKVLDLRASISPLDHFVAVDRVHMNDTGHAKKSELLLSKMLTVWPLHKEDGEEKQPEDEHLEVV